MIVNDNISELTKVIEKLRHSHFVFHKDKIVSYITGDVGYFIQSLENSKYAVGFDKFMRDNGFEHIVPNEKHDTGIVSQYQRKFDDRLFVINVVTYALDRMIVEDAILDQCLDSLGVDLLPAINLSYEVITRCKKKFGINL